MTFAPPTTAPVLRSWRLEWRGKTYRESDLRGSHLAAVALITGDDWRNLDIESPVEGPVRLMTILTAFLIVESDGSTEAVAAAMQSVRDAPAIELASALRLE